MSSGPVCDNPKCFLHKYTCPDTMKSYKYADASQQKISPVWQFPDELTYYTQMKWTKRHQVYKPGPEFPTEIGHICDTCMHVLTMMDGGPV